MPAPICLGRCRPTRRRRRSDLDVAYNVAALVDAGRGQVSPRLRAGRGGGPVSRIGSTGRTRIGRPSVRREPWRARTSTGNAVAGTVMQGILPVRPPGAQ